MNKKISFSNKIVLLSFLLSVGVLYQHTQFRYTEFEVINAVKDFMFFLQEVCVPCFFMISGYLFYRNFSLEKLKDKYKSRTKSLLIPYIVWNIGYAIIMVLLYKLNFVHNIEIKNGTELIWQIFNAEFSPLWFVKCLMIFVLVAPLLYIVLKNKYIGILALIAMIGCNAFFYYTGIMEIPLNVNANNFVMYNYQMIFYATGAYSALHLNSFIEKSNKRKSIVSLVIIVVLCVVYWAVLRRYGNAITNHSFRLLFSGALWFTMDFVPEIKIRWWMKISFFIYCIHLILLQCIQGITEKIINIMGMPLNVMSVVEYITLPIFVLLLIIAMAYILKKYMVKTWALITGARG